MATKTKRMTGKPGAKTVRTPTENAPQSETKTVKSKPAANRSR